MLSAAACDIDRALGIVAHILVQYRLLGRYLLQLFVFFLLRYEVVMPQILHHGILNARPRQVLDVLLVAVRLLMLLMVDMIYHNLLLVVGVLIIRLVLLKL